MQLLNPFSIKLLGKELQNQRSLNTPLMEDLVGLRWGQSTQLAIGSLNGLMLQLLVVMQTFNLVLTTKMAVVLLMD